MKKILLASIAFLLLLSCSNDENTSTEDYGSPDPNTVLVKKIKNYVNGELWSVYTHTYDGTKIKRITSDGGYYDEFEYDSNSRPIYVKSYKPEGELRNTKTFTYQEDGRLESYTAEVNGWYEHNKYFYNTDGTITMELYRVAPEEGINPSEVRTLILENGNITTINIQDQTPYSIIVTNTFDGKNHHYAGIAGRDAFNLADQWAMQSNLKEKLVQTYFYDEHFSENTQKDTYTYDSKGYPVSKKHTTGEDELITRYYY